MFKFIKEWFVVPFKEGMEEARQELKQEKVEKEEMLKEYLEHIETIPYEEQFATALAAPFRIAIFQDWFTIFKNNDFDEELCLLHLYCFGDNIDVTPENIKDFQEALKRDFEIENAENVYECVRLFFYSSGIVTDEIEVDFSKEINYYSKVLEVSPEVIKTDFQDTIEEDKNIIILYCAVSAYILTSAAEIGYLEKEEVLPFLTCIEKRVREICCSWEEYANFFIEGEKKAGLNKGFGKRILANYLKALQERKYSPWNRIEWDMV